MHWKTYYANTHVFYVDLKCYECCSSLWQAVVMVIDSSEPERLATTKQELFALLEMEVWGASWILLAKLHVKLLWLPRILSKLKS